MRIEDFSATNNWTAYPGPLTNDGTSKMQKAVISPDILLMEEILHHLIW